MEETRKLPPKAFENSGFLQGKDARVIRMLSEYLEPASRLKWQRVKDTIVFFGSARVLPRVVAQKRLQELQAQWESLAKLPKPVGKTIEQPISYKQAPPKK